jgi:hypothetical protein
MSCYTDVVEDQTVVGSRRDDSRYGTFIHNDWNETRHRHDERGNTHKTTLEFFE